MQVNVIGTIIFLTAVGFVLLTTGPTRGQRPDPMEAPEALGPARGEE